MLLNSGMTKVNIDQLSEEELVELNHKIVARLRFLRQMQSHAQMLDYRIGERVRFYPAGQPEGHRHPDPLQQEERHGNHRERATLERASWASAQNTIGKSRKEPRQGATRYVSATNV